MDHPRHLRARPARAGSSRDFVATASHELRSPLTSIKGFVELLGALGGLGEREREFVDVILQSTDRLVDLVNDLLDVARIEAGKMEVHPRLFDVDEVVREVATLMGPRIADKRQQLDVNLPPGLPRALADPARVRQIVTNLISNAHLYTDEGGRIAITLDRARTASSCAVADNGRGMTPEEHRARLRPLRAPRRRRRRHRARALDREVARGPPGRLDRREERARRGHTFTVRLPAEPTRRWRRRRARRSAASGCWWSTTSPTIAALIAAQLEPLEVETEIAHDGDEALERLREGASTR